MIWKVHVGFHGERKGNEGGLLRKALEGRTFHTQDSNEPLNTRRKGGGNLCTSAALSTQQPSTGNTQSCRQAKMTSVTERSER